MAFFLIFQYIILKLFIEMRVTCLGGMILHVLCQGIDGKGCITTHRLFHINNLYFMRKQFEFMSFIWLLVAMKC